MNRSMRAAVSGALLALVCAAVTACQKEAPPAPLKAAEPTESAASAPEPVKDELPAGENGAELQTPEDFEEEAAKAINEDNLKDQIDALEKELDADR